MNDRIQMLKDRFEAFSLRERALISLALIVVLYLLWDTMIMSPEGIAQQRMVEQMHSINQQVETFDTQIGVMSASMSNGEAAQMTQRINELQGLLQNLQQQEKDLSVEFIRPEQMAGVLREVLEKQNKLVLTRLESLGAEALFPTEDDKTQAQHRPRIYKHGVRVVLEGDFFSTLKYLQALEALPWRFYWDNVEYQVLSYPRAQVAITLHTLSLDEDWIGV